MQRLRRLSTSSSSPAGGPPDSTSASPTPSSGALHRSSTAASLSQRSPFSPLDTLRRTPSSHLLSSAGARSQASTALCTAAPAEATVVRAPSFSTPHDAAGSRRLGGLASSSSSMSRGRSSSRTRVGPPSPAPEVVRSSPIPISPSSPSAHSRSRAASRHVLAQRRDSSTTTSALAAAIRSGDPTQLRAERRRTELVDSRFVRGVVGTVGPGDLSDGSASGESYEVEVVDTRAQAAARAAASGGLVRGASGRGRSTSTVGAGAPLVKPVPRYSSGRRLSCLATYEGLPIPTPMRGRPAGAAEPELEYSLHGLRGGSSASTGERPRVRRISSSAPGPQQQPSPVAHRPSSPAPEGFKSGGMSPLTRAIGGMSTAAAPRRPSSPGPGIGLGARRASSPVGPRPSGLVAAAGASPSSAGGAGSYRGSQGSGSVRRAPSPSPGARSSTLVGSSSAVTSPPRPRAPSPARTASGTKVVYGFDAPARPASPTPSRPSHMTTPHALARPPSPSLAARHAHSAPVVPTHDHLPGTPTPHSHATVTRPRSRMADQHADERLEVLASRDFAVLDEYYSSRRRGGGGGGRDGERGQRPKGERREGKREAEERLRRGYDRSLGGGIGAADSAAAR
ncbi:hypothetical protein JCM3775_003691 [Rhodotorula graminis]|uniref:Uncharacterized protein n=1 Tax=Rhodotorula graminis (strain WP1) TaxID=578459 RepID=A0A194S9P2_RHOGW|nr:uncharacterized protein RHOBADRAFT_51195 [Rhodotorula graminis WP1]KPV77317.1 hypothetical protein RHOBADRAFT_51195 [Rhodotorula graminis WP1]